MSTSSNLVVPVVLWGRKPPTHCIAAILMTPDQKNIITGCNDGQIGIWDVSENSQVGRIRFLGGFFWGGGRGVILYKDIY